MSGASASNGKTLPASSDWERVRLGDVLRQRKSDVSVVPTERYRFAGVYCFGRGVFRGRELMGNETAYTELTKLRPLDFVYPKLMAWEGAFGVVPAECDGCVVSPEFPVFEVAQERLHAGFLGYLFKTPSLWEQIAGGSTGTNVRRRRLNPSDFLSREIPLPPLPVQERIATKLDAAAERAAKIRQHLAAQERDLRSVLIGEFWRISRDAPRRLMREIAPLERRPVETELDQHYPEIAARSFGRGTFQKPPLLGSDLTWQKLFRVCKGDLLFSNIKAWEGAVAVVADADDGRFGSHRYLTCVPNIEMVTANFVWFFLLTPEGLRHLGDASPGSADRNRTLGADALMAIPVPVPPLDKQREFDALCAKVNTIKAHAAQTETDLVALERSLLRAAFRGEL